MQSSLVTALRSCVMLLSLVAVPLAAVFGTGSWPRVQVKLDELRQELVARLDKTGPARTPATTVAVIDPIVVPAQLAALPGTLKGSSPSPATSTAAPTPPPSNAAPSSNTQTAPPPKPALSEPPVPAHFDSDVRPASYSTETPQFPDKRTLDEPADRAGWIQHRLQTLGADWYRLESLVAGGETFRFQCKMGSPTNPNYVRYFEATSPEPLRAMQHVLDQVDAWVVGRDVTRR